IVLDIDPAQPRDHVRSVWMVAVSAMGGASLHDGRRAAARGPSRRPRPEKVVSPDWAECVEQLAAEKQPGMLPALHRSRVDLPKAHPAAGHFGLPVPFVSGPRQLAPDERLDDPEPLCAPQIRKGAPRIDAGA